MGGGLTCLTMPVVSPSTAVGTRGSLGTVGRNRVRNRQSRQCLFNCGKTKMIEKQRKASDMLHAYFNRDGK